MARYGGKKFALCLPATEAAGAVVLCERLRARVEAYDGRWTQPHSALRSRRFQHLTWSSI